MHSSSLPFFQLRFYDTLQRNIERGSGAEESLASARAEVFGELLQFAWIVAPAVVVHPVCGFLKNWWVFVWCRTLICTYLLSWDTSSAPIEGASQRVHEDTQRFASGIQSCVSVVLDALFTLAIFCPTLYALDPQLMTVAVSCALGGLSISVVVGSRLVGLEVRNQVAEAALRKELVVLEVDPEKMPGNATPASGFKQLISNLTRNYFSLYVNFAALSAWLSAFDQFAVILPYLLVAPRLFAEDQAEVLTLGQMMKVTNSFGKVFDSLNIVSDNWLAINEWRSTLRRLREFETEIYDHKPPATRLVAVGVEMSDATPPSHTSAVN